MEKSPKRKRSASPSKEKRSPFKIKDKDVINVARYDLERLPQGIKEVREDPRISATIDLLIDDLFIASSILSTVAENRGYISTYDLAQTEVLDAIVTDIEHKYLALTDI